LTGQPAAVVHQETTRAGELVGLLGDHPNRQFLAGEVGAGQLVGLDGLRIVHVNDGRLGLVAPRLQFLEGILGNVIGLGAPWGVIVGSHRHPLRNSCSKALYQRRTRQPNDSCPNNRPGGVSYITARGVGWGFPMHGGSTVQEWSRSSPTAPRSTNTVAPSDVVISCPRSSCSRCWPSPRRWCGRSR